MRLNVPYAEEMANLATRLGVEAYYVGGVVRDQLLGRASKDVDVVTVGVGPESLLKPLGELVPGSTLDVVGRFGTSQLRLPNEVVIEGVMARSESYFRHSRKPDVKPASLRDDIERRDFTINTLLVPVGDREQVIDITGLGLGDLQNRVLRTPCDPTRTFNDDPLRILRGVRFASKLGFNLEPETQQAMEANRERLAIVSRERIQAEMNGILVSGNPSWGLELLGRLRLLPYVGKALEQLAIQISSEPWQAVMQALETAPEDLNLRWVVLCGLLGEYEPGKINESGRILTQGLLGGLRYQSSQVKMITEAVKWLPVIAGYEPSSSDTYVRELLFGAGAACSLALKAAEALCDEEKKATLNDLQQRVRRLDSSGVITQRRLPVSGDVVMAELGLSPGKEVGGIQRRMWEAIITGAIPSTGEKAAVAWLRRNYLTETEIS